VVNSGLHCKVTPGPDGTTERSWYAGGDFPTKSNGRSGKMAGYLKAQVTARLAFVQAFVVVIAVG